MELYILVAALGFVFIIEGIPYAASPESVKRFMARVGDIPDSLLRIIGIGALAVGLLLVFLGTRILH